jgi:hypothetical protein
MSEGSAGAKPEPMERRAADWISTSPRGDVPSAETATEGSAPEARGTKTCLSGSRRLFVAPAKPQPAAE